MLEGGRKRSGSFSASFASSSAIFLLPYLLLFPAVIRLRRLEPDQPRPFRVPGGRVGVWAAVILATGSILASLVLFLWTPGVAVEWSYTGPLLGIVAAAIAVGEVVVRRSLNRASGSTTDDGGSATPTGGAHEHAVPEVVR